MNKNNKKVKKVLIIILIIIIILGLSLVGTLYYITSPISKESNVKTIKVEQGYTLTDIAKLLKEENLIRNEKAFIYYAKLKKADNIYAATFKINQNMNFNEILDTLCGVGINEDQIKVTFTEGMNMRSIAKEIAKNTNNTQDEVLNKLKDTTYIDTLINKYWFLTDSIKNKKIYYPLEGYLFPETYCFSSKNAKVEEIFEVMLDEMAKRLEKYKEKIQTSKYSIHELITLASLTQSEAYFNEDFKKVASVFYNRLSSNMPMGSCVTSYYGVKKEMTDELLITDINAQNAYNTRGNNPVNFPIGPISNPGEDALSSVLEPIKTDYYFFVSDKNHKLYFTKTNAEHESKVDELVEKGLWYEW